MLAVLREGGMFCDAAHADVARAQAGCRGAAGASSPPPAQGHRFASPGQLTWCRGLPLLQRVSQPLGTDISRVGVSVSPCEAILPCMKMHKYSWVSASDSDSMSITAGICATTGAARGVGKHQEPGRGFTKVS